MFDHLEGCAPLTPCNMCRAMAFLRSKLSEADFATLVEISTGRKPSSGDPLDEPVSTLGEMTVRLSNTFINEKVTTIRDVLRYSEASFLRTPNIGRKTLNELKELLKAKGYTLGQIPAKGA